MNYTQVGMGLQNWSSWGKGIRLATRRGQMYPTTGGTNELAVYYTVSMLIGSYNTLRDTCFASAYNLNHRAV